MHHCYNNSTFFPGSLVYRDLLGVGGRISGFPASSMFIFLSVSRISEESNVHRDSMWSSICGALQHMHVACCGMQCGMQYMHVVECNTWR